MVVPTMLARVVDHLTASEIGNSSGGAGIPSLRTISYGGRAHARPAVLRRAMELFPDVGFVNAYGLTETSSTIALLDPEDHRAAFSSERPGRPRPSAVGRSPPPGRRARSPRRRRSGPRSWPAWTPLPARGSRSPANTPTARPSMTTAGSPPVTAAGWTRTGTSSSRDEPTTPSSVAERTSRRRRSRRSSCPARAWRTPS